MKSEERSMPSPFPGMDPYLEGSAWPSFHSAFANEIARQLVQILPEPYTALPEEGLTVSDADGVSITSSRITPDASLVADSKGAYTSGRSALMERPLRRTTTIPEMVRHHWVEIRSVRGFTLVTAIEILS